MNVGFKINKRFAIDIGFFYKQRKFKDGISFFELNCNLDLYKDDHKPEFTLTLVLLNFIILDIDIYNMYHLKK